MKSIIILLIVGMALNASLRESNYEKLQAQMNIMKSTMSLMDAEMKGMQSRAGGDALTTSVGMGKAGGCNSNCLSCCDHAISDATTLGNCHDGCNTGTWTISVCSGCCSSGSC